ncbi:MAG: flagellar hook-basal body protein [Clostridiales bacterium]|nr:flagellar hook-basal body protein [Clostridiales bacterium]
MIRSLYTATTGMRVQQHKIDAIGNNIANVSTTGYKSTRPDFKETLYDVMEVRPAHAQANLLVGNGVRAGTVQRIFTQGALRQTNNRLDLALEGPGFFAVGYEDGQNVYTRDGTFKLSYMPNGQVRLDNMEGYPVLDQYGQPIIFYGDISEDNLTINQDGSIYLTNEYGSFYQGTLGIYTFADPSSLQSVRASYFMATEGSGQPVQALNTRVIQGYLEQSNVDMAKEMTELIIAQRAYQLNSRVVQTADEMEKQANSLRG